MYYRKFYMGSKGPHEERQVYIIAFSAAHSHHNPFCLPPATTLKHIAEGQVPSEQNVIWHTGK